MPYATIFGMRGREMLTDEQVLESLDDWKANGELRFPPNSDRDEYLSRWRFLVNREGGELRDGFVLYANVGCSGSELDGFDFQGAIEKLKPDVIAKLDEELTKYGWSRGDVYCSGKGYTDHSGD